ncbi:helix-turn-helix domain-containing protein [Amycolatopsis sp. NPDC059027]|uniref:helix-turn-helix domain-containing protein n=1 Tax=Amycolatopsis sp. NPDC059027 TaxID=3346709 RepID=UPI00366DDFB5
MTQELFSVEQVAARLGLHVRTVRNYVRDGRLKAVRIGKQYRVAAADLAAFTGLPEEAGKREEPARRHVEVSSIVQIEGLGEDEASRVATHVVGSAQGHRGGDRSLRVETSYDKERARMKIIVLGDPATTADVLSVIAMLAEGTP